MNKLKWISIAGVIGSSALLYYALTVGGDSNWVPATLPYPGDGLTVREAFEIMSAGCFRVEVETASEDSDAVGMKELPPAVCDLDVTITHKNGFRLNKHITTFRRHSQCPWGRMDFYAGNETFDLPRRGEYTIELSSKADVPVFAQRGGIVRLSRFQPLVVEAALGYDLDRVLAYVILGLSVIGILIGTRKNKAQPDGGTLRR